MFITGNVLDDLDERREVDALLLGHALRLQQHQVVDGLVEEVYLKVLTLPDETTTCLTDGGTIGIGLLQQ